MNPLHFLFKNLRCIGPIPDGPQLLHFCNYLISLNTSSYFISSNCAFVTDVSISPRLIYFGSGWYLSNNSCCCNSVNSSPLLLLSNHCSILSYNFPIPSTSSKRSAYFWSDFFSYFSELYFGFTLDGVIQNISKNY